MANDTYVRRNPDGSITVGRFEEKKPEKIEAVEPVETEEKPAPKKGGRPKKK